MSRYTAESVDRVREAVDMVALISDRVDLRRAGVNSYFGRCPFHDERTASFHVRPDEKHYHCFGCQQSGDAFRWVMELDGLDFKGTVETLADRFGVTLELEDEDPAAAARHARRARLFELMNRAALFYSRFLWEAQEAAGARAYLADRGLLEETLREFRVGYAPKAWDRILVATRRAGYTDEELLATGLVVRSRSRPGSVYDRFRGRIIFPLADARSRVVGFGARALSPDQQPKYLNTSEGELFHKGRQLFAIDKARAEAARAGKIILAEGYTDVLALHQAGLRNSVGIMGTSFTEDQAREVERTARTALLALDADRAGQDAMLRAADVAKDAKLELRVVPLPEGVDPADLVLRDGPDAMRTLVEDSKPFVAFRVDRILAGVDVTDPEAKDRAGVELAPMLRDLPPSALKEDLYRRAASRLELSEARFAALLAGGTTHRNGAGSAAPGPSDHQGRAERNFLILCVALGDVGRMAITRIDRERLLRTDLARAAAERLVGEGEEPADDRLDRYIAELHARAARGRATPPQLEHAEIVLVLLALDREIARARADGGDLSELSRERQRTRTQVATIARRIDEEGRS